MDNDFLQISFALESLENYIDKAQIYPNFKSRKQLFGYAVPPVVFERATAEDFQDTYQTQLYCIYGILALTQKIDGEQAYQDLKKKEQTEFYQWIDYAGITADNCPETLKNLLFALNEIIELRGKKLYREIGDYLSRHKESSKEEVANLLDEVSKVDCSKLPPLKLKGDAEKGETTFNQIIQNLDHENFHFYEPLTEEEKKKKEQKPILPADPIIEGAKISAQREINSTLLQKGIKENDLTIELKNKIKQVKDCKKITEINKLKYEILTIINKQNSSSNSPSSGFWICLITGVLIIIIGLAAALILYKKRKKNK
ncbi:MAG: hypothetical protein MRERC_7c031 [Mycoplasmataceae bacterium RC_NB112A]|nr:MAG: hypothetical protein MRERC_8c031 [Mycoplasmataceae bacterium RC_NB112A]KLL01877.1 MAG: hypothetical protein MRERC_7c031 [Mycoplasmataceae bacterium RC_NB112A]